MSRSKSVTWIIHPTYDTSAASGKKKLWGAKPRSRNDDYTSYNCAWQQHAIAVWRQAKALGSDMERRSMAASHKLIVLTAVILFPLLYAFFTLLLGAFLPEGILF